MKGQDNTLEKQLNEEERGKLPEKEFRMMVKMIQDLGKTMKKMQETFTKDPEELKNKQTEMNNTLQGINRITEAEEQIHNLKDRMAEIPTTEQNIGKKWKEMKTD